jgi:hypothetical protein
MIDNYQVVPVPAYELDGTLMCPTVYQKRLMKAVVELHFTLSHFTIAERDDAKHGNDVYTPDLHSMCILKKPSPTMNSPRKRKIAIKDPMESGSSTKKQKTG